MKFTWKFSLLLFLLINYSCKDNYNSGATYLGGYRVVDEVIPYPYLLHQEKDSVFYINNKGDKIAKGITKGVLMDDTIVMDNQKFLKINSNNNKPLMFNLSDTTHFFTYDDGRPYWKHGAFFNKLDKTPELVEKKEEIREQLENLVWKFHDTIDHAKEHNSDFDIQRRYNFSKDSVTEITSYYYQEEFMISEKQRLGYQIFAVGENLFLSFLKEKENPQPVLQITGFDKDQIQFQNYSLTYEVQKMTWEKESNHKIYNDLILKSNEYANCYDAFQTEYYAGDDVTHRKGNEFMIDFVSKNAPVLDDKNGYIIIHFNINCEQKLGDFGLMQMSRTYQPTSFHPKLVKHIVQKVHLLDDWPTAISDSRWRTYKDAHAFLMFKIGHGKIIDLCP